MYQHIHYVPQESEERWSIIEVENAWASSQMIHTTPMTAQSNTGRYRSSTKNTYY